jgi:hypothetical protein
VHGQYQVGKKWFCDPRENRDNVLAAAQDCEVFSENIPIFQCQGIPGNRDVLECLVNRELCKDIQGHREKTNDRQ